MSIWLSPVVVAVEKIAVAAVEQVGSVLALGFLLRRELITPLRLALEV